MRARSSVSLRSGVCYIGGSGTSVTVGVRCVGLTVPGGAVSFVSFLYYSWISGKCQPKKWFGYKLSVGLCFVVLTVPVNCKHGGRCYPSQLLTLQFVFIFVDLERSRSSKTKAGIFCGELERFFVVHTIGFFLYIIVMTLRSRFSEGHKFHVPRHLPFTTKW